MGDLLAPPPFHLQKIQVQSLGQEDPLEQGMATPTPVFMPGEFHGWRSLAGYSPWGLKELDTTERLHFHLCTWRGQGATAIITLSCKHLQLNSLINLFCSYQRIHLSTPSRSVQLTQWPRGYSITHEHAPLKGTHQLMGVPLCVY